MTNEELILKKLDELKFCLNKKLDKKSHFN